MNNLDPGTTGRGRRSRQHVRPGRKTKTKSGKPAKAAPSTVPARAPPTEHTISVPEAGKRYFGISKNAAYQAAADGQIPTIKVGRLLRVPVRAMERKLEQAGA